MEKRRDTQVTGTKLPREYLKMVEDLFNKNFAKNLSKEKGAREQFIAYGEIYPDEVLICVSLKNQNTLRLTTCYASVDYPPVQLKKESGEKATTSSETVQFSVNQCVDAVASFFNTFFAEGRPVDYDEEYRQGWTLVELDKHTRVHMLVNRDNPDLEAAADDILKQDAESSKKKKLH